MIEEDYTEEEKQALEQTKHLNEVIKRNTKDFVLLGLLLNEAKGYFNKLPNKYYATIYDFAKSELQLCKTTVKYYLSIHNRFCQGNFLKDKYEGYNFTQLREMVSLSDEDLNFIDKSMTAEDIKKCKKNFNKIDNEKEQKLLSMFIDISFKNKEERLQFLKDYTKWQLYKEIPEFTLKFYRAKLSNGAYIIATESYIGKSEIIDDYYYTCPRTYVTYCVMNKENKECRYNITGDGGMTAIEKYMSANKLKYIKE